MGFVDFVKLPSAMQQEVRDARPLPSMRDDRTLVEDNEVLLRDCRFWVRKDGHMSRAKGMWKFTDKADAALTQMIKNMSDPAQLLDPPGKGSLREWKPGTTFGLDRIPLEGLK
jgi:hypothetical protein